jgi:EAL domain-containing protein (putative c-di-GMP-specific phosphodiesterase class I)/FixJ family two-component response regulator
VTANPVRVLVIDDEADVGELIAAAAASVGLGCAVTTNYEAFRKALSAEIAVLVIDLMMPGVDGIEVLRNLAGEHCRAHIVLMSGFDRKVLGAAEELARSLGLDVAGHLVKPFRVAEAERLLGAAAARAMAESVPAPGVREITEQELREAIEGERIIGHFQPQVELATGRLVGVEVLARLRHSRLGLVYPNAFIGVAERSRQIDSLTVAILRRSLSEFAALHIGGGATLSVNVSALSLTDVGLPDRLLLYVTGKGLRPQDLVLEITESGLIKELATALDILTRLRLKGFGLSIDDFGTGYSSMAQLRRIPAAELKIDQLFVAGMLADNDARALVRKTIELGHELGMRVVAEGVETEEQAATLLRKGCDVGQGYYFAKPMAVVDLAEWIKSRP